MTDDPYESPPITREEWIALTKHLVRDLEPSDIPDYLIDPNQWFIRGQHD